MNPPKIDWFLHQKFYPTLGLGKKQKRVKCPLHISTGGIMRLIGCKLHQTHFHITSHFRILPSDNAVFVIYDFHDIDDADFPDIQSSLFTGDDYISFKGRVVRGNTSIQSQDDTNIHSSIAYLANASGDYTIRLCFKGENAILKHTFKYGDWLAI